MVFDLIGARVTGGNRVGKLRDEFLNRPISVESDLDGVRSDERAAEDAARQARDVVALERFERGHRDLGRVRNLAQRNAAALARFAQRPAEIARRTVCAHVRHELRLC